jgi:hypothetical protein
MRLVGEAVTGGERAQVGRVVDVDHPERAWGEQAYRRRFARVDVARADRMVVIDLRV